MSEDRRHASEAGVTQQNAKSGRFLGSLKDALAAASRDDTMRGMNAKPAAAPQAAAQPSPTQKVEQGEQMSASKPADQAPPTPPKAAAPAAAPATVAVGAGMSAAEAAAEVKGQTSLKAQDKHVEFSAPPTTRVVKGAGGAPQPATEDGPARTQLVRGKVDVKRGTFQQDPVVGWLVIVGGPGIGSFRPIFEGNNTVGRGPTQRVPLDFGDDSISSEEQAYIRYDSSARSFLFVPNLAKTNIVSVNDKRPTGAVELNQMDVITMGRTQLVFVPFCGSDFDWAELTDKQ